jgi:hypothetical protein
MRESLGDERGVQGLHCRFLGDLAVEAAALVEGSAVEQQQNEK